MHTREYWEMLDQQLSQVDLRRSRFGLYILLADIA